MPKAEPNTLTPEQDALVARLHELLKDAKPGEPVTLPPDLVQAMDDAARDATLARLNKERLAWLHSSGSYDVDGWEWGIFRVKWLNDGRGSIAEVQQTLGSFADLDAAIERSSAVPNGVAATAKTADETRNGDTK